jgi:hypothetical protein
MEMTGFTSERRRADRQRSWSGVERRGLDANRVGAAALAEMIDPTAEEAYWRENYDTQPHYQPGYTYEDYHPAYRTGWEGRGRYEGRSFDEAERELEADYNRYRGSSRLGWDQNRNAARAAWDRFDVTDDFERSQ